MTTTGDWVRLPKQSRELNTRTTTMSVSRKSEIPPFEATESLGEDSLGGRRDLSQSPESRQERTEESGIPKTDTDDSRNLKARPPPAMPLTPPAPSSTYLSFQDRRLSIAASTHGDFDPTLTQGGASGINSPESTTTVVPNVRASSPISMRKSYTKIFPLDPLQPNRRRGERQRRLPQHLLLARFHHLVRSYLSLHTRRLSLERLALAGKLSR